MRLCEVRAVVEGIDVRNVLVPTDDTFKDSAAFHAAIEKDGEKYKGKDWVLLSEDQLDRVVTVDVVTTYRAKYAE